MIKTKMAALSLALLAMLAHADDYVSPTEQRVSLSLGVMHVTSATDLRLDSSQGATGTYVDVERVFGMDRSDFEPKFEAWVRAGERNRLRFDYFMLDRTGNSVLTAPIVFRNVDLLTGDPVTSSLSIRTFGISYEYSFLHSEKFELAAVLGVNDTDISASARVFTQTRHVDQQEDQAGPFPTVGLDSTYVLSKRFYLDGRIQYFRAAGNNLSGMFDVYQLAALYRLRANLSVALGYTGMKAALSSQRLGTSGKFDFSSKGPELFVKIAF